MKRSQTKSMMPIAILAASAALSIDCTGPTDYGSSDKDAALNKNAAFRSKWNEPGKRYRYSFSYWSGLFSETQRGECIIGDTIDCISSSSISDPVKSKSPGRISDYFDKMDSILMLMDPDSIRAETPSSYSIIEMRPVDTLSVPYGYSVYFNAGLGHIDSLFFLPFGPNLRVRELTVE